MTTTTKEALEPTLEPCRCGRKALIERFYDGDDPQPLFVATCEICPVKTYDQFSMEEAARIWNEFVSATVNMPDGQWQHVQIKAGNPRVVAIQFETPEQATAFINSFAAASAPIAPVVDLLPHCWHCGVMLEPTESRLRCDQCSADCDDELCNAFGCTPQDAAPASTVAPQQSGDFGPPSTLARKAAEELRPFFTNDMNAAERASIKPATVSTITTIIERCLAGKNE